MSILEPTNSQTTDTSVVDANRWAPLLQNEEIRLQKLGIRSGLISIDFSDSPAPITRDRAVRLLRRMLRPTDWIGITSETSVAVLQAPLQSLSELDGCVRSIDDKLAAAGLAASIGFAHRREDESLLDTWARADAQADRATFRLQVGDDGQIILS